MTDTLLQRLQRNEEHVIEATPDGVFRRADYEVDATIRLGILAGSFNPMHDGHVRLRAAADQFAGLSTRFEMSVTNADKPPLAQTDVLARVGQFDVPILLTNAPVFARKAELFPSSTFVVGYDTAERILRPKYYDGRAGLNAALATIRDRDCSFLVAARVTRGVLLTRESLAIPFGFGSMFDALPESEFREDISSTALRRDQEESCNDN